MPRLIKNDNNNYLIFQALYDTGVPPYTPSMIINICLKFIWADKILREDIKLLLDITDKLGHNDRVIELEEIP